MEQKYKISQQLMAFILLTSLFLQSCGGLNNTLLPIEEEKSIQLPTYREQQLTQQTPTSIQHLVNQTLLAEGGHAVTFYEEANGEVKTSIEMAGEKYKVYNCIPVKIEEGTDLKELLYLPEKVQPKRVHFQKKAKEPSYVSIHKPGCLGGGDKGKEKDNVQISAVEKETENGEEKNSLCGLGLRKVHGRKHISAIEFPDNLEQQEVAPHLGKLETWKGIPEFVVITGKNGSGKSQLLKYIEHKIKHSESEVNVIFRGSEYDNSRIHCNANLKINPYLGDSEKFKRLVNRIKIYYDTFRKSSENEYRKVVTKHIQAIAVNIEDIEKAIEKGLLPKSSKEEGWNKKIDSFIYNHIEKLIDIYYCYNNIMNKNDTKKEKFEDEGLNYRDPLRDLIHKINHVYEHKYRGEISYGIYAYLYEQEDNYTNKIRRCYSQQDNIYKAIIKEIDNCAIPQSAEEEGWDKEIGNFITEYHDYSYDDYKLSDPISLLNQVFSSYANNFKELIEQHKGIKYSRLLFPFYCETKNKDKGDIKSYENFLCSMENIDEFVEEYIEPYLEKSIGSPPWKKINEILDTYGFKYRVELRSDYTNSNTDENFTLVKNLEEGFAPVKFSELSAGEKMMLELMSWLFYFHGVSIDGKNRAHTKNVDILLLDEPDRHLDPDLCGLLYKVIDKEFVKKNHIQVFITTHRLDTIVLAPENSIYTMGEGSLEHDKISAVDRMTKNMIAPAINSRSAASILSGSTKLTTIKDVNYVLVEDEDDVKFYNIIYQKLQKAYPKPFAQKTELIFMPVGLTLDTLNEQIQTLKNSFSNIIKDIQSLKKEVLLEENGTMQALETNLKSFKKELGNLSGSTKHGSGSAAVKKKVNKIPIYQGRYNEKGQVEKKGYLKPLKNKYHNSQVLWGMVDNDDAASKENQTKAKGKVHSLDVYSFENYLCMPLNLFYCIKKHKPEIYKSWGVKFEEGESSKEALQKISNLTVKHLKSLTLSQEYTESLSHLSQKKQERYKIFEEDNPEDNTDLELANGDKISCNKKIFFHEQGHNLVEVLGRLLNQGDEKDMLKLLFDIFQEMPVDYLPKSLLDSIEGLQNSKSAS
jgi:ABC-type multidrug transport system ATPase subunit